MLRDVGVATLLGQIAPIFAVIALGVLAARSERFGESTAKALNDLVYYLALPAVIFGSIATADVRTGVPPSAIGVAVAVVLVAYLLGVLVALAVRMPAREANAVGIVGSWGNVGYLGIPLSITVLGPTSGLAASVVSTLHTALAISLFVVVATIVDHDPEHDDARGGLAGTLARRVLGNPVVIAAVAGAAVSLAGVGLPGPVATTVDLVGAAAAPGGLFALGILLRGALPALRGGRARFTGIVACVVIKLVVMPAIAIGLVAWADVPAPWGVVIILLSALPDAATVFVLTAQYRTWYRESTAVVVLTTAASVLTLPVLLALVLP